jgi:hypothetical protein
MMGFGADDEELAAKLKERIWLLKIESAERKRCTRFYRAGETGGTRAYKLQFKTCTDFALAAGSFDRFFPVEDQDTDDDFKCYNSGFRYGYMMANIKQWEPCAEELTAIIERANVESIERCKKNSELQRTTFQNLKAEMMALNEKGVDQELSDEYARIVFFSENGYGGQVWDDLLKISAKAQTDIVPCHIIMASGAFGEKK